MINPSQSRIGAFLNSDKKIIRGVEKENLRSNAKGEISNKGFPESLGSHHFNKFVTLFYVFEFKKSLNNPISLIRLKNS